VIPAVEALAVDERGALLALLIGGAPGAGQALAGAGAARCRAALDACAVLPPAARAGEREALKTELTGPVPPGLEGAHPGWLRRALEGESSALARAAARGLPEVARVADELLRARGESGRAAEAIPPGPGLDGLRRGLFGALAPIPVTPLARALCALPGAALLEGIDRRGAATLGLALAGAAPDVLARAAVGVGEPLARVLIDAARAGADEAARAAARRLVATVGSDEAVAGVARAVGLRVLARELRGEGAASVAAVAQRLAPAVGDALLSLAAAEG
jgi:hypothetical protein